jgi:hypothetical protein
MTAPARVHRQREESLPAPELVSLPEDPIDPQTAVQAPWWAEYGGTLDEASGVVSFPPRSLPPCPFPCERCQRRQEGA